MVLDGVQRLIVEVAVDDVSELGADELERLVAAARRLQRVTSALLVRAAMRATELAHAGVGPGPDALMTGRGEVSAATARADGARAEVCHSMPVLAAALASGAAGPDHVDLVAGLWRRADDAERAALVGLDGELAGAAGRLSVSSFDRRVHRAMVRVREGLGSDQREVRTSGIRWWWGRDNRGRLSGELTAEQYERLVNALGAEMSDLARRTNTSAEVTDGATVAVSLDGRLAAEAMVNKLTDQGGGRVGRPALTIVVDAVTVTGGPHDGSVRETGSGGVVSSETIDRCACDAVIRTVTIDARGVPIDVGRAQRTATDAQWAALGAMYSSCAWYGCDRPLDWCQAHHVVFWEHLGPTDLDNLVPLCSRHHHLVHEGGWRLELGGDRRLGHIQPDGTHWRTARPDRLRGLSGSHGHPCRSTEGNARTRAA